MYIAKRVHLYFFRSNSLPVTQKLYPLCAGISSQTFLKKKIGELYSGGPLTIINGGPCSDCNLLPSLIWPKGNNLRENDEARLKTTLLDEKKKCRSNLSISIYHCIFSSTWFFLKRLARIQPIFAQCHQSTKGLLNLSRLA